MSQAKVSSVISRNGSVRYMDGTFYTGSWEPVFVPLDKYEYNSFMRLVEINEDNAGRRLSTEELGGLAKQVMEAC